MRDAESGSEWLHYTGEGVAGPLEGRVLTMLETSLIAWSGFRRLHPMATVAPPTASWARRLLGRITGSRRPFHLPDLFRRTMRSRDDRLPERELGLGVVIGQRTLRGGQPAADTCFYPYAAVRDVGLLVDDVGGHRIAVAYDDSLGAAVAFFATTAEGRPLELRLDRDGTLVDVASGSRFDLAGRGCGGPLAATRLRAAPGLATRWYGFAQTYPGTRIGGAAAAPPSPGTPRSE